MNRTRYNSALTSQGKNVVNRGAWLGLALLAAAPVLRAQTVVTNGSDFNTAIDNSATLISLAPSTGTTITTVANTSTGTQGTVTYSSAFPGPISSSTSIEGNGNTLNGSGATPLFLVSPQNETATGGVASPLSLTVSLSNLTVTGGVSQGGTGGSGGAGLGGAIFVGTGYQVTLSNVTLTGNAANGGSTNTDGIGGGGGGIGGSGVSQSNIYNDAGGGLFADAPGTSSPKNGNGGGANGGAYSPTQDNAPGGNGGFGGGGGVSGANDKGGDGGFGSGGGANQGAGGFGGGGGSENESGDTDTMGNGGFGGGGGVGGFGGVSAANPALGADSNGGPGAGFGGAIFVQNGANVVVTGNSTFSGNTVTGGVDYDSVDVSPSPTGAAAGSDIFIMTGSTVTLAPGVGNVITIGSSADDAAGVVSAVADDSVYSIDTANNPYISTAGAGSGAALTIGNSTTPGGLVVLHGNNTYAGGTVISNGVTLEVFQDSNLGASVGGVSIDGAELLTGSSAFSTNRAISVSNGGIINAVTGTTGTFGGVITADTLTIGEGTGGANTGIVILTSAANQIGSTVVDNGTLQVVPTTVLNSTTNTNNVTLTHGGMLLSGTQTFNSTWAITLAPSGGALAALSGTTANYSTTITGGPLTIGDGTTPHNGTVVLGVINTYSGGTTINGGTAEVATDANLGNASGGITLNNGGELLVSSSSFSTSRTFTIGNNGGTVAALTGVDLTIGTAFSGTGGLTLGDGTNTGTFTLTGTNTQGGLIINNTVVKVASDTNLGQSGTLLGIENGAELVTTTNGFSSNRDIILSGNVTIAAAAGTTLTLSGSISDITSSLTLGDSINNGTIILTGNSDYSGTTTVTAGLTVKASSGSSFGASSAGLILNNGSTLISTASTYDSTHAITVNGAVTLAADNGTIGTYEGTITGGTVTVGQTGELGGVALYGTNTFTGGLTVADNATLYVNQDANFGADNTTVTLGDNSVLVNDGNLTPAHTISMTSTSVLAASTGVTGTFNENMFSPVSTAAGSVWNIGDGTAGHNGTVVITTGASQYGAIPTPVNGINVNNATLALAGYINQDATITGANAATAKITGAPIANSASATSSTALFIANSNNETATGGVSNPTPYLVQVSNVTVTGGVSQGGIGASGGAGLGGGIFAGTGATVILANVNVTGNAANGGASDSTYAGGGGMGGNGYNNSTSGGGGLFANAPSTGNGGGSNGGTANSNGGFGGGGGANQGNGGFGGGGAPGGNGGFGGGSGSSGTPVNGGFGGGGLNGGFGGGNAFGGGAGFGGGIFVQNGATVVMTGSGTVAGNTVSGGVSGNGGPDNNGAAGGSDIFLMTGSSFTLAPGTGSTITIGAASDDVSGVVSAVADDSTYTLVDAINVGTTGGSGAVLAVGSNSATGGTVVLHGNNTYAGGTTISNSTTLEVFQDANLGAYDSGNASVGNVTLSSGGELLTDATGGFSTNRKIIITDTGALAAASGTTATYNGSITGGALTIGDSANHGTVVLPAAGTYAGNVTVKGGTFDVAGTVQGNVTVQSGGQLGGSGTIQLGSGGQINVTSGGILAPGGIQPVPGPGAVANGNLAVNVTSGTATINVANAGLTFALGAGGATSGSKLVLGSGVTMTFSGVNNVTINSLIGYGLQIGTDYVLIDGGDVNQYGGLLTGPLTDKGYLITGGLTLETPFSGGVYFPGSALYLTTGGDIVLDVVPEPSTYGLLLGGLALLVLVRRGQRGRRSV